MRQVEVKICGVSGFTRENLQEQLNYCKRILQEANASKKPNSVVHHIKHEYEWLKIATTTRTPLRVMVVVEPPPEELEALRNSALDCNDPEFWGDSRTMELQRMIYRKEYKEMGGEEEKQ